MNCPILQNCVIVLQHLFDRLNIALCRVGNVVTSLDRLEIDLQVSRKLIMTESELEKTEEKSEAAER